MITTTLMVILGLIHRSWASKKTPRPLSYLLSNPLDLVKIAHEKLPPGIFTADEIKRFFLYCPERYRLIFSFLRSTGVRVAELMGNPKWCSTGILWEEIDIDRRAVTVRTAKNPKQKGIPKFRTIKLHPNLYNLLNQVPRKERIGQVCSYNQNLRGVFEGILKKARIPRKIQGMQNLTLHSFRHAFGTNIQELTGDVAESAYLLGHSNLSTTMIYVHTAGNKGGRAIEKLDKIEQFAGKSYYDTTTLIDLSWLS